MALKKEENTWNIMEFSINVENASKVAHGGILWVKAKDKEKDLWILETFFAWGVIANFVKRRVSVSYIIFNFELHSIGNNLVILIYSLL